MVAENVFQVDPEALAGSAAHVFGYGEDLANAHLSSDNRMATAESGWVGSSALALSATTATWSETSRRLLTRVGGHALDLNNDGIKFAATERANAAKLAAVTSNTVGPAA